MRLPDTVKAILARYVAQFPIPKCEDCPDQQREQVARQWTYGFVQQVCYELPGQGWGTKRSKAGHDISKDTITQRTVTSGQETLTTWDILVGAGTGAATLNLNASSEDTTGQVFEAVTGVNLLNTPGTGGTDPGGSGGSGSSGTVDLSTVLQRLDGLEAQLAQLLERLNTTAAESQARDAVVQGVLFQDVKPKVDQAAHESLMAALRTLALVSAFGGGDVNAAVKAWFGTVNVGLRSGALADYLKSEQS